MLGLGCLHWVGRSGSTVRNNPTNLTDPTGFVGQGVASCEQRSNCIQVGGNEFNCTQGNKSVACPKSLRNDVEECRKENKAACARVIASVTLEGKKGGGKDDSNGGGTDSYRPDKCDLVCINQSTGIATPRTFDTGDRSTDFMKNWYSEQIAQGVNAVRRVGSWWTELSLFGLGGSMEAGVALNGASNRALFEFYKDGLIAKMAKPEVTDPKLHSLINDLYRPGAKIGSGSTADAVRYERLTGEPVGEVFHTQKAENYIAALKKWIQTNANASPANSAAENALRSDRAVAENVIRDLENALKGK